METAAAKNKANGLNAWKTAIPKKPLVKCVSCSFFVQKFASQCFTYQSYQIPTGSWFQAMKEAGFFVPESFDKLPDMINQDSDYCSIDSSNSLHHFWVNSGDIQVTISHQSETLIFRCAGLHSAGHGRWDCWDTRRRDPPGTAAEDFTNLLRFYPVVSHLGMLGFEWDKFSERLTLNLSSYCLDTARRRAI